MSVNWSIGQQPNIIGNALDAFRTGRNDREAADNRNALLDIRRQESEQRQAESADKHKATQREEHVVLGKLLDHAVDEPSYQQSLAAAKQYGIDTTGAPPNFDPNWVGQQKMIVQAFAKDGGQAMSAAGKQAIDMGYHPGTPEFNNAVREIWTAGESKPYVVGGETRLYSPKIGGQGQVLGQELPPGFTLDQGGPAAPAGAGFPG